MTYGYEQIKTKLINAYTNIFEQMFNPAARLSPSDIHSLLTFMFKEESTITLGMRLVTLTKTIPIELENYEELKQVLIDEVPRIVDGYLWAKKYSHYSPALNERIFKHEAHYKFTKICEVVGLDIETLFDVSPEVESNYDWVNESQVPQQSRAFADIIISTFSQEFTKWLDTVVQKVVHTRTYQGPDAIIHKNFQYVKVLRLLERICSTVVDVRGGYVKSPYTPDTNEYMIDRIYIFPGSHLLSNKFAGAVSYNFTYDETDETTYEVIAMRNDTTSLERLVKHAAKEVLRHYQTAVLQQDLEDIEKAINMLIHRESQYLSINAIEFHFIDKLPELVDTTSTDLENNEDAVVVYLTQWLDTIFTDAVSVPEPGLIYSFNQIFEVLNERFQVGAYVYDRDGTPAERFINIYIIGKNRIEIAYPHPRTVTTTSGERAKRIKGIVQEIEAALNPFYPLFAKRIYDFMIDKYGKFDYDVFVKALPSGLRPATPFGADTMSYDWANESYKQRIDADLIIGNIIELLYDITESKAWRRLRPSTYFNLFEDICSVFKVPSSFIIVYRGTKLAYRISFNGDEIKIDYDDNIVTVRNFFEQHYELIATNIYNYMLDKYGHFSHADLIKEFRRALSGRLVDDTVAKTDVTKIEHGTYDWANESATLPKTKAEAKKYYIKELTTIYTNVFKQILNPFNADITNIMAVFNKLESMISIPKYDESTDEISVNGEPFRVYHKHAEAINEEIMNNMPRYIEETLEYFEDFSGMKIYADERYFKSVLNVIAKRLGQVLDIPYMELRTTQAEQPDYTWVNESYEQGIDADLIISNIIELLYDIVEVKARIHMLSMRPSTYFNLFEDICYVFKVPSSFKIESRGNELAYRVSFNGDEIKIDYDDNIVTVRNFFEQHYELIATGIYNYMVGKYRLGKYGHFSHANLIKEFRRALTDGLVRATVAKTDVTKVEHGTYDWVNESATLPKTEAAAKEYCIKELTTIYTNAFKQILNPFSPDITNIIAAFNALKKFISIPKYDETTDEISVNGETFRVYHKHAEAINEDIMNTIPRYVEETLDYFERFSGMEIYTDELYFKSIPNVIAKRLGRVLNTPYMELRTAQAEQFDYTWANESLDIPDHRTVNAILDWMYDQRGLRDGNFFLALTSVNRLSVVFNTGVTCSIKNDLLEVYDNGHTIYRGDVEIITHLDDILLLVAHRIYERIIAHSDAGTFTVSIFNELLQKYHAKSYFTKLVLNTTPTEYTWVNESQEVELMDLHRNFIALWLDEVFADYHERNRIDSVELLLKDLNVAFNTAITASSRNKFASYVVTVRVSAYNSASFEIPVVSLKNAFNYAKPYLVEKIYQHVTLVSEDGNFSVDAFNEIAALYHLPPLALTGQKYDWVNESLDIPDHRTVNAILDWIHDQRGFRDADGSVFITLAFVNRLNSIFNTGVIGVTNVDLVEVRDDGQVIYRGYLNIKNHLDDILLLVARRIYERVTAYGGTDTLMEQTFNELLQKYHDKHYIAATSKFVLNTPSTDYAWANEAQSARTQYRNGLKVALTEWLTEMIRINQGGAPKTANRKMLELIQLFWTISWAELPLEFVPFDADHIGEVPVGLKLNYLPGKKIYCVLGEGPDTGYYTSGANADNIYVNLEEETTVLFEIAQTLIPYTVDVILTEWDDAPALTIVKTINRVEYLIKESAYLTKVPEFNHPPEPQSEDYSPIEENEIKVQLIGWLQDVYDGYRKKLEHHEALEVLNQKMRAVFKTGIYLQRLDTKPSDNYAYTAGFSGRSNDNYYFELTEENEEEVLFEFLKHVANRIYEANVEITENEFDVEYFNRTAGASGFPPLKSVVSKDYQWASEAINNVEKYKGNN